MTNLQTIQESLLESYKTLGIINGYGRTKLPSRDEISSILILFKELLFPGFAHSDQTHDLSLEQVTQDRLSVLKDQLEVQLYHTLSWQDVADPQIKANEMTIDLLSQIPKLREVLRLDARAIYEGDPASESESEIILSYPGFQAIMVYRIAHYLYKKNIPLIPRMMTEIAHSETGIDIHPGATIGEHFFIDHGTGIVLGETAVIGNHVKLYQGVTLGAFSVSKDSKVVKRHPTLEDHVTVYARSTILGGDTVIGAHSVIGGNVWLTESVEPYSTIYVSPEFKRRSKLKK